jgi:hypothetical protein
MAWLLACTAQLIKGGDASKCSHRTFQASSGTWRGLKVGSRVRPSFAAVRATRDDLPPGLQMAALLCLDAF